MRCFTWILEENQLFSLVVSPAEHSSRSLLMHPMHRQTARGRRRARVELHTATTFAAVPHRTHISLGCLPRRRDKPTIRRSLFSNGTWFLKNQPAPARVAPRWSGRLLSVRQVERDLSPCWATRTVFLHPRWHPQTINLLLMAQAVAVARKPHATPEPKTSALRCCNRACRSEVGIATDRRLQCPIGFGRT